MHLNGWQRIGIVASVAWVIGGACWGYLLGTDWGDNMNFRGYEIQQRYERCMRDAQQREHDAKWQHKETHFIDDSTQCYLNRRKDTDAASSNGWLFAALLGLLPIPLGWAGVYGSMALTRWIRKGFETQGNT
jgi:hypothetical protein